MIFRQITHDDLGCASYLIGDEDEGVAAVVDPRFEVDDYLELARYMGVSIEHVLETHNHADHVSGHGRLAAATGARVHIHRDGGARLRARAVRGRMGAGARLRPHPRPAHARPPARAHRVRADRPRSWRGPVGDPHRRHPVRRRRRAPRSRDRQDGGGARDLPLPAREDPAAPARHRGVAGTPRRLDVRRARAWT